MKNTMINFHTQFEEFYKKRAPIQYDDHIEVLECLDEAIIRLDTEGRITYVNHIIKECNILNWPFLRKV